jgi:hypothetical protein
MANKMLVERVDDLEAQYKHIMEMLALNTEFMELIKDKLPQYDVLLETRKLMLSKAKAMRLAKRKKRQVIAGREEDIKHAR